MNTLVTDRTFMRPFQYSDAQTAFEWLSDSEVMRYIPFGGDSTLDQTIQRISRYIEHQSNYGFSKWLIHENDSKSPIGDSGFFHLPDGVRVELGYRLKRSHWNRGIATEVARSWLSVAKDWFGFTEVYAFAHPENSDSLHVLQKLGFTYFQTERLYGIDAPLYRYALPALSS
jgi:RimJ/RimL family protein N-acetyltransferase